MVRWRAVRSRQNSGLAQQHELAPRHQVAGAQPAQVYPAGHRAARGVAAIPQAPVVPGPDRPVDQGADVLALEVEEYQADRSGRCGRGRNRWPRTKI